MHIECAYVITFVFLMERIGGHVTDIVKILWIFTFIVLFVNVLYLIYIYIYIYFIHDIGVITLKSHTSHARNMLIISSSHLPAFIFFTIKYDLYIADPSSMRDACQIWT